MGRKTPYTVALIPARKGSKRLPGKNTRHFLGKPLVQWSVEAGRESTFTDLVVVSSDSEDILDLVDYPGVLGIKRPPELATDGATSESVIVHAIFTLREIWAVKPELIVLLQPTSPQRDGRDIDSAVSRLIETSGRSLVSGFQVSQQRKKDLHYLDDGTLSRANNTSDHWSDEESDHPKFRPNGAMFIFYAEDVLATNDLLTPSCIPFPMDPARSVDIDTLEDFRDAELAAQKYHSRRR